MKLFFCVIGLVFFLSCSDKKQPLLGDTEFQKEMNSFFKDASKSPLKDKDRKNFKGLEFFKYDSTFVVKARITRTPDSKSFKMKTTTDRLPTYKKYGILEFEIDGKAHQLSIYQNLDDLEDDETEDYLFLPFLDNTNGEGSYPGGRYINTDIPKGDTIIIDFNSAYNPYCAYNEKYSCPIVPRENYLDAYIKAGVKDFNKSK